MVLGVPILKHFRVLCLGIGQATVFKVDDMLCIYTLDVRLTNAHTWLR